MRIIQLIDSLEPGGAERMAVHYANALTKYITFSGLVVTRKDGALYSQIDPKVSYLYLNKKKTIDFKALFVLRNYVLQHKVTVVHAHSSSFFLAFLLKLTLPSLKLIWHDHYGNSEFLSKRPSGILRIILPFFNGIIAVNQKLKDWADERINSRTAIYLPNFPSEENAVFEHTILRGIEGKRIVCVANLREQKDHFTLLRVAKKLKVFNAEWTFHLIGKDFGDDYSKEIRDSIVAFDLEKNVFLYGSKQDIKNILDQSTVAVLTSKSEGLPVALLEYGWHKKPIVVTNVGEIAALVQNGKNGFIVPAQNVDLFYTALLTLVENDALKVDFGDALYASVVEGNSENVIIKHYLNWLETI
ncbi:glycosyltransferase [Flavobacterium sinopsychrotolerans]|uniref:Glycosyltransferase involved in cell wall bisynthesis n=1 Tax=Flavobacterium sinopsychrotolerans TaxID=604089 RepID=A0A1H8RMQ2_9FLAO|nr:glycosyltransferase [Flavobacterium sinopsychrotolerans]SEO67660.1 Glycosyltransferase involved in cell wall bisynthesis [Flavobacterium sinopsychrotolerans]